MSVVNLILLGDVNSLSPVGVGSCSIAYEEEVESVMDESGSGGLGVRQKKM